MFKNIWDIGELYDDNFPSISKKSQKQYSQYCKDTYGLTSSEVKEINFKGRTYLGKRIDYRGEHLAFIVIASLVKGLKNKSKEEVISILSPNCNKLGSIINAFRDFIPSPNKVKNKEDF